MPGRLQLYVLRQVVLWIVTFFLVFASMELLIDFVAISRDVGARVDISPAGVARLTLMKAPAVLLVLLPFVFLGGTLAAYVTLNRRSELTAMRAAGVSAWRFIFPAAATAFLCGVAATTLVNPAASRLNARYESERSDLMKDYLPGAAPKEIWLREGKDRNQVVIHARSGADGGVLKDVSAFFYLVDDQGVPQFQRRVEAREARVGKGGLVMSDVRSARPGGFEERSGSLLVPVQIRDPAALLRTGGPDQISFWDLPSAIRRAQDAGLTSTAYQIQLQQLLAVPLLYTAMAVLAAAFSLRLMRLGGLAGMVGSGIAIGFALYFLNALCGALGRSGVIPTYAAAWATPALALLSGLSLLCYTEDG
ncbi:MAG: LptF/LptG family permease [Caulobacteraceae bacterium]